MKRTLGVIDILLLPVALIALPFIVVYLVITKKELPPDFGDEC